jgi:hypothetical protein
MGILCILAASAGVNFAISAFLSQDILNVSLNCSSSVGQSRGFRHSSFDILVIDIKWFTLTIPSLG